MAALPGIQLVQQAFDYWTDAWQRSVLFLDVLRQRGNNYLERAAEQVPNVLRFRFELVMDGRDLPRPVNYGLVRIVPPAGTADRPAKAAIHRLRPARRTWPRHRRHEARQRDRRRARAGHPCYFVGFLPDPCRARPSRMSAGPRRCSSRRWARCHPEAEGKPVLIGNCQAGWQIMMMSGDPAGSRRPDPAGRLAAFLLGRRPRQEPDALSRRRAGRHLADLAGRRSRPTASSTAPTWVANFENLDPANTFWKKTYNVYSKVDTEAPRFLEFEKWWGSPVLLNADEMQSIADELFVGNKLASGRLHTSDGRRIDLRNIKSPIVVFCSWGDNITPPQQALDWITRPLRKRQGNRRQRPDHHLRAASDDRPSRHLRLRQGGDKGTRGVRPDHRSDRRAAARALRGGDHREGTGKNRAPGTCFGKLPRPLRGPHAR